MKILLVQTVAAIAFLTVMASPVCAVTQADLAGTWSGTTVDILSDGTRGTVEETDIIKPNGKVKATSVDNSGQVNKAVSTYKVLTDTTMAIHSKSGNYDQVACFSLSNGVLKISAFYFDFDSNEYLVRVATLARID